MNRRQLHYVILLLCRLEVVQFLHINLAIYFSFAQKSYILIFGACGTKRDEFAVKGRTFDTRRLVDRHRVSLNFV